MSEEFEKAPELELRFWMAGQRLTALAELCRKWWDIAGGWVRWPLSQLDPLECSLPMLKLLGWQRNINRYKGVPERLYRLRVKFAYANGVDSGNIAGWQRIFKRLELPEVELEERVSGQDWDIINIVIDDSDMPDTQNVLEIIIDDYGRTCRRYRFVSRIYAPLNMGIATFDNDHCTVVAVPENQVIARLGGNIGDFDHEQTTVMAVL